MSDENGQAVVRARGLSKRYGDFTAVDSISFEIRQGENLAFLGPNGAGKSTTIRMIYGFTTVTSGELTVLGYDVTRDVRKAKMQIGVVPQEENLDRDLSVFQQLIAYARYFRIPRIEAARRAHELIEFAQLQGREESKVEELSGGMKRRLMIARALLNRPKFLILDEPTTGLDPSARHFVWQKLRQLNQEGLTILLTTHYMEEAEKLSDRCILVEAGKIFAEGKPAKLVEEYAGAEIAELHFAEGMGEAATSKLPQGTSHHALADTIYVHLDRGAFGEMDRGAQEAAIEKLQPREVLRRPASLEDVFLKIAGKSLRD